jgi:phenylalanyl-tRNA synthetase beta chain
LAGLNMLEASSYYISNKDIQLKRMGLDVKDSVEIANSKSEEYSMMRYTLLANLMQILKENTHNEYPQKLFETGYVFKIDEKEETGVKEICNIAVVLCNSDADYTKIRQVADYLFNSLGLKYNIKETNDSSFIKGRAGKIIIEGKEIGVLGEISPQLIENFEVEMPVVGMELTLEMIFSLI